MWNLPPVIPEPQHGCPSPIFTPKNHLALRVKVASRLTAHAIATAVGAPPGVDKDICNGPNRAHIRGQE
eukprot:994331-Amphidinium_carterae.1